MKKKILVALFAMMSVASASAYYIEIDNKTNKTIKARLEIPGRRGQLTVKAGKKKRFSNPSEAYVSLGVKLASQRGARYTSFTIPKPMRGKNITIKVKLGKFGFRISPSLSGT